jgi:antitoxin VapB
VIEPIAGTPAVSPALLVAAWAHRPCHLTPTQIPHAYFRASGALEPFMSVAKLFSHGGSQAVCLPKEFHFKGSEVHVRRVGSEVVLSALPRASLQAMLDALDGFEPGVHLRREQPAERKRVASKPRR